MPVTDTFTVVIPTYKRPTELGYCLTSIISQSVLPNEVLIVDDDQLADDYLSRWKADFEKRGVTFTYYRKDHAVERRGLSESKNVALKKAAGDVVFYFDDDVVLEPGFLEAVVTEWKKSDDPKLLGVGGLIRNARKDGRLEKTYNALFGLTGDSPWDVNDVAYVVWDEGLEKTTKGYYMHGGVSSYRRTEALKIGFATFSGGRTALEDLDFSLTAKKRGYYFLIVPKAKVAHNHSDTACENEFLIGLKDSVNRRDIYRRLGLRSMKGRLWFSWAAVGWVLRLALGFRWSAAAGRAYGFLKPL